VHSAQVCHSADEIPGCESFLPVRKLTVVVISSSVRFSSFNVLACVKWGCKGDGEKSCQTP